MSDQTPATATAEPPTLESLASFFELRDYEIGGKKAQRKVIIQPMTREVARRIFPYRPHSRCGESRYGGGAHCDDACLIRNCQAAPCKMCSAVTLNGYLDMGICPDCDGRAIVNGTDPYLQTR